MSCAVRLVSVLAVFVPSISFAQPNELEPGLTYRLYDIGRPMERLHPLKPDQTPNVDLRLDVLDLDADAEFKGPSDHFYVEAFGKFDIKTSGRYAFRLTSDDGSRLFIDESLLIDNDGQHAPAAVTAEIDLTAGFHPFHIDMFENAGGAFLRLEWKKPGDTSFGLVPASAFRTEAGVTRVVSPGRKILLDGREYMKPGDGLPLESVHPGWRVETIRPEEFFPRVGAMDFLPDGSLVLSTFMPVNNGALREKTNGDIWILDDVVKAAPGQAQLKHLADGFHDPSGIVCVDTDIYVSHRPGITRLRDLDHDGRYETRESFAQPWIGDNYHHFSFGLQEHDGWIYGTLSTSIYFGNTLEHDQVKGEVRGINGPNPPNRGTCYRINIETGETEFLAGGFRTPNGILVTTAGDIFVTDNQGAWMPSNRLNHVLPGHFYGHYNGLQKSIRHPQGGARSLHMDQQPSPPAVWLPQNDISNSPTTPLEITDGPFEGQLYVGELTAGGIRRIFLEEVNGERQGAVFRFTQGLECGVNRLIWGPDGALYAGGTGADGNWNWRGTQYGLQRLVPTGETVFEFHSVSAEPDGFTLRFTEPISADWLGDPANYDLTQWNYFATPEYGGPRLNQQRLVALSAVPSRDGTSVRLQIPGLRKRSVVHIRCNPKSVSGEELWSKEAWYTLNHIPHGATTGHSTTLLPIDTSNFRGFRQPHGEWHQVSQVRANGPRLLIAEGAGVIVNGNAGFTGDLQTTYEHGDIDLHVEFLVPEGSNSGVYLQGRYEVQILDSFGKTNPTSGDCGGIYQRWDPSRGQGSEGYEGHPPSQNVARPAGEWQTYDITFRAPRFDPLGNKIANARFERIIHNGTLIHENVELTGPTRGGYEGEAPFAPLRLQGDHGPVAYRNIRISPAEFPRTPKWPTAAELESMNVLVFTKTAGFRHGSISAGIKCFQELAREHGFRVIQTEDAAQFEPGTLDMFDVIVFLNTTGDILSDEQQAAFRDWYSAGHGFLGVHAASDTEYDWAWYAQLVGAHFRGHPPVQPARIMVHTREHPATAHLTDEWTRTDEWYDFKAAPVAGVNRLLSVEEYTYVGGGMGREHPIAWCREFDNGRTIYTAGGHTNESYAEPAFRQHLLGAVIWAAGFTEKTP